jgi:RNA polymerase sigma factor (sigma-70 family)
MAHLTTPSIAQQLGALFDGGSAAGLSDRQLIERFNHRRDDAAAEAAFAALVARHGPMVLGVCRQLLGDRHLAEDAFQATFLVLARKASSLRDPDRHATWLYGVALRTARKARTRFTRQRQHEQGDVMDALIGSVEPTAPPADQALLDRDQRGKWSADAIAYAAIETTNYGNGPASERDGRIAMPALIPGATYCVSAYKREHGFSFRKDFTVKPAETLDLGDIPIEKPPG